MESTKRFVIRAIGSLGANTVTSILSYDELGRSRSTVRGAISRLVKTKRVVVVDQGENNLSEKVYKLSPIAMLALKANGNGKY